MSLAEQKMFYLSKQNTEIDYFTFIATMKKKVRNLVLQSKIKSMLTFCSKVCS